MQIKSNPNEVRFLHYFCFTLLEWTLFIKVTHLSINWGDLVHFGSERVNDECISQCLRDQGYSDARYDVLSSWSSLLSEKQIHCELITLGEMWFCLKHFSLYVHWEKYPLQLIVVKVNGHRKYITHADASLSICSSKCRFSICSYNIYQLIFHILVSLL